jgi:hypothetical protein
MSADYPRPWRPVDAFETNVGPLIVAADGSTVCEAVGFRAGRLIVELANAGYTEHPPTAHPHKTKSNPTPVTECHRSAILLKRTVDRRGMITWRYCSSAGTLVQCLSKSYAPWHLFWAHVSFGFNSCSNSKMGHLCEGGHFSHRCREDL